MWDLFVLTQYSYFRELCFLGTASLLRYCYCHGWVRYIDITKITVLRFVWDCSVYNQYSYYCYSLCSISSLNLCSHHHHGWVHYTDTTNITVWCMSLVLLSIDLQPFCYFIMFYFKLTNGTMVKWWMVKLCNGEIKISIGRFFSHKYRICSFVLFLNTTFLQQKKEIHNLRFLITNKKYSNPVYVIKPSKHWTTAIYQGSADSCEGDHESDFNFLD